MLGEFADSLVAYMAESGGFDVPFADVAELQIAALNERLQERRDMIPLVGIRARNAEISEIRELKDVVPLLLPHTAYKSYPESFVVDERWDKLTKWLKTVSTHPLDDVNLDGIDGIDEWVQRLHDAGHPVGCSSGTTGKNAIMVASPEDIEFGKREIINAYCWGAGVEAKPEYRFMSTGATISTPKNAALGMALFQAFARTDVAPHTYPVPPITIGSISKMVALRKAITDGTALPNDIAEYEATSAERQKAVDEAIGLTVDAFIEARNDKIFVLGMWAGLYAIANEVRSRGYSAKDFHPDNLIYVGGGLKGAQLPEDYREVVYNTFNIRPERNFQMYGMQEINTTMPRCRDGGRYHVPPWVVSIPLSQDGEQLAEITDGEFEARAAFFDLSLDGRWGGVISGDRIKLNFSPCACGARSPSIGDDVVRYADLEGDDKIACSGTVDAYVRGLT